VIDDWGYGMHTSQHTVRVWETATQREVLQFTDNPTSVRLLAISPDKRILVHGVGRYYKTGSLREDRLYFRDLAGGRSESLDASRKGEAGIDDWLGKKRFPRIATGNTVPPYCLTFSPDGKHLATGGWDGIVIWNVEYFIRTPREPH
jgi:WD40 repeat protein